MALNKQPIQVNFSQGLEQKLDPWQLPIGKFSVLQNTVFNKIGRLTKRNGFGSLASLPDSTSTLLTTFNGNLTAIGNKLEAYSQNQMTWVNKGKIQPVNLNSLSLIRSNTNQTQADTAVTASGLVCTVFTDNVPVAGSNTLVYKYAVADATTGQNIISPTVITPSAGVVTFAPRVFVLGTYFIVVFATLISASYHLQYFTINTINPNLIGTAVDITTSYTAASTGTFNGVVANNTLYLAWNGASASGIKMSSLGKNLSQSATVTFASHVATHLSMAVDITQSSPIIWVASYNSGDSTGYVFSVNQMLGAVTSQTQTIPSGSILNLAISAQNSLATLFYEIAGAYSYDGAIKTNRIASKTITQAGVVSSANSVLRGVGLASNSFIINSTIYFVCAYGSTFQPTYFISDSLGNIIAKLAYSNGGGYSVVGVPNPTVIGTTVYFPILFKDLIQSVNKAQGLTNASGIYSQTGINLIKTTIGTSNISTAETGNNLHLSGGFVWMYDGYIPVEHNFHLWPDSVEVTTSGTGGLLTSQQYFYQALYEWTDNQGNIHRSAPSIPVSVTTTGTTSSNTINVPTLRLTYKTANPVKIVIYRWSTAQESYFQCTSVAIPVLNDTTTDSIAFVDTLADASILGNSLIYTSGGVVENIAYPAANAMTLFDSRLWVINAEDPNTLTFSKEVLEQTPVEPSDLFTIYVSPSSAATGNTGPMKSLASMDDKLIIFKAGSIFYINGIGPDNTDQNNQYSQPTFITSTVGSTNQASIVMTPDGLMFQSDKGIWILRRDLSTEYIGEGVDDFNSYTVQSAVNVPSTNQVRFTLSNGTTLMYDYFAKQWGTFVGISPVSSTIYNKLHTFIDSAGKAFQETPGIYLDGSNPVLMSFRTGWINPAGLQGYQRAYRFFLLGEYLTPHALVVGVAFDYDTSVVQQPVIFPYNYNKPWGGEKNWGAPTGKPWGGSSSREQWKVNLARQQCQSFQVTLTERYDGQYGVAAGAGFTLSGLLMICGIDKSYPQNIAAKNAIG